MELQIYWTQSYKLFAMLKSIKKMRRIYQKALVKSQSLELLKRLGELAAQRNTLIEKSLHASLTDARSNIQNFEQSIQIAN